MTFACLEKSGMPQRQIYAMHNVNSTDLVRAVQEDKFLFADFTCANKMCIRLPYLWQIKEGYELQEIFWNYACLCLPV